jgi:hypothetical protein
VVKGREPAAVPSPKGETIEPKEELAPPGWSDAGSAPRATEGDSSVRNVVYSAEPTAAPALGREGSHKAAKTTTADGSSQEQTIIVRSQAGKKADKAATVAAECYEQGRLDSARSWLSTSRRLYGEAQVAEPAFLGSLELRIQQAQAARAAEQQRRAALK